VDIRGEHDLARLLDLVHLRQGCMPEGWQHGLGVLSVLTVAKHGGPGLRFDRFASHLRDKVREERHILFPVGPDFID